MQENNEKQQSLLERIVTKAGMVVFIGGIIAGYSLMKTIHPIIENKRIAEEKIEQTYKNEIISEKKSLEGYVSFVDTVYILDQPRFSYVDIEENRFLYPHDDLLIPGQYVRIGYVSLGARRIDERIFDKILNVEEVKAYDPHITSEHMKKILDECAGVIMDIRYIEKAPKE